MSIDRVAHTSMNITNERLQQLYSVFPEIFVEGKVNIETFLLLLGEHIEESQERYEFNWSGKREAIRLAQIPTRATLIPVPEQSVDFPDTQNIFIEGENLEVLKLLLRPYFRRVKMIYIDPPYNTGNDFVYHDDYSDPLEYYLYMTGQIGKDGHQVTSKLERNGRFHSAWLSMMYPRLTLARQLLRDDGVIFVSIDYNEEARLRVLMDMIFGEENYRNTFVVARVKKNIQERERVKRVNWGYNSILFYARSDAALIVPPTKYQKKEERWHGFDAPGVRPTMEYEIFGHKPPQGRHWMYEESKARELIAQGRLRQNQRTGKPEYKLDASDFTALDTNWTDLQESDSKWLTNGGKNPLLIRRMLQMIDDPEALILDFFAGSGTTAEAVMAQNVEDGGRRQFILVQIPKVLDDEQKDVDIAELAKQRLASVRSTLAGKSGAEHVDLGYRVFRMAPSHFVERSDISANDTGEELIQLELFAQTNLVANWDELALVFEVALKEGFCLDCVLTEICTTSGSRIIQIYDRQKNQNLFISLENTISLAAIDELGMSSDDLFICLESALDGNDTLAANLSLRVKLKTI